MFKVPIADYTAELSNVVLPSEFANVCYRRNATDKIQVRSGKCDAFIFPMIPVLSINNVSECDCFPNVEH